MMLFSKVLNVGMCKVMESDLKVLFMGEDIGKFGGVFCVIEYLQCDFGDWWVFDILLVEFGIVGIVIGMVMVGYCLVIEIQFDGFVFFVFDQIIMQFVKFINWYEGVISMLIVICIFYGGYIGVVEYYQESLEVYFVYIFGLCVVLLLMFNDVYWMIQEVIVLNDLVIFMELKSCYWQKGEVEFDVFVVLLYFFCVVCIGSDVMFVGYGVIVMILLQVVVFVEVEGISCEVVDVCLLLLVDYEFIFDFFCKIGCMVYVQEVQGFGSIGSEIVVIVMECVFYVFEVFVLCVFGYDILFLFVKLEGVYFLDVDCIFEVVDCLLVY